MNYTMKLEQSQVRRAKSNNSETKNILEKHFRE